MDTQGTVRPVSTSGAASLGPDQTPLQIGSARVRRRLIPFLFVLYIVSYLDRINVGFAALQMNRDLGFSPRTYGFGVGIFFLSYVLLEIPSNLMLERFGVRRWIARIVITWGLVSSCMMFVRGANSFFAMRFLLGAAEAGFFPGIILYLTRWFPAAERARSVALFMTATALAGVVGGPVSALCLSMNGTGGLAGWQWLFLLEGLPAIVLGVLVFRWLPDRPADANWLPAAEREAIEAAVAAEHAAVAVRGHRSFGTAAREPRVWAMAALYFTLVVSLYGIGFWLPQIVRAVSSRGDAAVAAISAIPYVCAAVGMVLLARHSDRTREREWHVAGPALLAAAAFVVLPLASHPAAAVAVLAVAALGVMSALGPFWTLPPTMLTGAAAAGGIALINSVGNLGGFAGPYLLGYVREQTGSFASGLYVLAGFLTAGAILAVSLKRSAH